MYQSAVPAAQRSFAPALHFSNFKDHIAQFYESELFLIRSVSQFVLDGLKQDEAVVVIARSSNQKGIEKELTRLHDGIDSYISSGQLTFLDAEQTLAKIFDADKPDPAQFETIAGSLIRETLSKFSTLRAYGEMVDVLRGRGEFNAMIRLEELWNELAKTQSFTLLCGYLIHGFKGDQGERAFEDVCERHLRVVPSEGYSAIVSEEEKNLQIAILQRKALDWEAEHRARLRAEKELALLKAGIESVEQTREEFLSIASHELKTPLTSLMLQLEIEKRRLKKAFNEATLATSVENLLDMAERQTAQMANLIEDMLDSARLSNGSLELDLEPVDLGEIVMSALSRRAELIQRSGSRIDTKIQPNLIGFWDRQRIEQVVGNLLSNALKYGEGEPIELSVNASGNLARFAIADHGIGIRSDSLERVFDRFERAVSADYVSGLGLGLYICRKIVEMHDGQIWAESGDGGSTFFFTLPLKA
jgi:signal transduction histidine kinase